MKRKSISFSVKALLSLIVFGFFIFMAGGSDDSPKKPSETKEETVETTDIVEAEEPEEPEVDPVIEDNETGMTQKEVNEETEAAIYDNTNQFQNEDDNDINE